MKSFPTSYGISLIEENRQVVAVTDVQGQKKIKSFQTKNKVVFWNLPFARGLQFFCCGVLAYFESFLMCIDLRFGKSKKKTDWKFYLIIVGVALGAATFSGVYFGFLPSQLGYLLVDYRGDTILRNAIVTIFKLLFANIFFLMLRLIPKITEMLKFNYAYEKLNSKIIKKPEKSKKSCKKEVNFLNYLIFVFILSIVVITFIGASFGIFFNMLLHIAIAIACISVGYEILFVVTNFVPSLIWITGFLVFSKPTRTHTETIVVALEEMKMLQKGREFMSDESKKAFAVVYANVKSKLSSAGITDKSDADWIIATILGKTRGEIKLVSFVTDKQYEDIMKATERRANGESVDNIFGFTEFYGIRFDINKKVLTPRMETELLVEQTLKAEKSYKKCTILDVGTGSGAIAIALAKNCDAQITAVDVSKSALAVAENNARKNDVKIEFLHSNLFDGLKRKRKFDIIVSNPPYIATDEIEKLDKNVRECDPVLALDGGKDGLDFYREIISQAPNRLNPKGQILFEVGKGQALAVKKLLREHGFDEIKVVKDYNKIERIVSGRIR